MREDTYIEEFFVVKLQKIIAKRTKAYLRHGIHCTLTNIDLKMNTIQSTWYEKNIGVNDDMIISQNRTDCTNI